MKQYAAQKISRPAMTAVYAAQSPNTEWDVNVHLGDRLLDTYFNHATHRFDDAMRGAGAAQIANTVKGLADKEKKTGKVPAAARQNLADMQSLFHEIDGKTLKQLTDDHQEAAWTAVQRRAHRAFESGQRRRLFGDIRRKKPTPAMAKRGQEGEPMVGAFGTLDRIENAIRALRSHGDANEISEAVGDKHKVRSFYNNILDPKSANDDVTIDTHAGGAAWMYPFGGKDTQVQQMRRLGQGRQGPASLRSPGSRAPIRFTRRLSSSHTRRASNHGREAQSVLWMKKISCSGPCRTPTRNWRGKLGRTITMVSRASPRHRRNLTDRQVRAPRRRHHRQAEVLWRPVTRERYISFIHFRHPSRN
jgi:hypothetical protein